MSKDSLEHIIRQKFDGASSTVPSGAWNGIETQLGSAAGVAGTGSISVLAKVIIGASISAAVAVTTYFVVNPDIKEEVETEVVTDYKTDHKSSVFDSESTKEIAKEKKETRIATSKNNPQPTTSKTRPKEAVVDKLELIEQENILSKSDEESFAQMKADSEIISTDESQTPKLEEEYKEKESKEQEPSQEKSIVPTKILSSVISKDPLIYLFKLDQLDKGSTVQWFVNEEFISNEHELSHEQTFDAELAIMALVSSKDQTTQQLFKNVKAELPMAVSIPNIFSPNRDAFNSEFTIDLEKSRNVASYVIIVKNSRGELIFESTENQQDWTGDLPNGNPAPVGTYFYIIQARSALGQTKTEKGKLQLNR